MELYEILIESVEQGIKLQREDGRMPPGHNGPWNDPETPVRNTSHWLITFSKAYEITGEEKFKDAAEKSIEYLTSEEARPHDYTFHHRKKGEKTKCNGLVGQAWTIEALVYTAKVLDRDELMELAEEVFLLHPFNQDFGLWQRVEIDGELLFYDMTLNHQLWFAASGSMIESSRVREQVECFLDNLEDNMDLYSDGTIVHHVARDLSGKDFLNSFKNSKNFKLFFGRLKHLISDYRSETTSLEKSRNKAVGYHSFNTYALALIKQNAQNHAFWSSDKFKKALNYSKSEAYESELEGNSYGFPFNPPGIENAFTLNVFEQDTEKEENWITLQLSKTFDFDKNLMDKEEVVSDMNTYSARIYEASRLPNYELELNDL